MARAGRAAGGAAGGPGRGGAARPHYRDRMSDGWVGALPPAAVARLQRMRADGVRTSFLSVPGAIAAGSVGLRPVGEVMGCTVANIGWRGWGGCGAFGYGSWSTTAAGFGSYKPYTDAVRSGYRTTLERLRAEAQSLGADGVIGVRLTVGHLGGEGGATMSEAALTSTREFLAVGTAVRVDGDVRPRRPFVTDLSGSDTAKLMSAGWMPTSIAIGLSVGIRHDDYRTLRQSSSWLSGNTEIDGYTALVQHVRAQARDDFRRSIQVAESDGALQSASTLRIWEIEPNEGHTDHVAEAFVSGTTIAQFARGPHQPAALSILPLSR